MKNVLIIILAFTAKLLSAQNFTYKAKLEAAPQSGFYRIALGTAIAARSQPQMQDLRLFDDEGKEVPFLLRKETAEESSSTFTTYPVKVEHQAGKQVVLITNPGKKRTAQLLFEMKNAEASRLVRISGSDDRQKWYVVRDSFYFESYDGSEDATIRQALRFPASDYAYYKIEISKGSNESPLNILNVGNYNTSSTKGLYQQVEGLSYTRKDSARSTYLYFRCTPANRIDKLEFGISGPEMYKRTVILSKQLPVAESYGSTAASMKRKGRYVAEAGQYELSSQNATVIYCSGELGYTPEGSFQLRIDNQDNAPLELRDVRAYQLTTILTARLDKGKSYFLYFGDSLLPAPVYDIVYFESNLPKDIPALSHQAVAPKQQQVPGEYSSSRDKYIVWIGLGLAGVIILLLTLNMMKKINT